MEMERRAARAAENRPVYIYTSVSTGIVLYSEAKLVRITYKDKNCITFSFPPFSGLPIILI